MKALPACSLFASIIVSDSVVFAAAPVDQLVGQYFLIQKSLTSDSVNGIPVAAPEIAKICRQSATSMPQANVQLTAIAGAASRFQANNLESARKGCGDLSEKLIVHLNAMGSKRNPPYQFYCPTVQKNYVFGLKRRL